VTFGELSKNGTNLKPVILRSKHSKIYQGKNNKIGFSKSKIRYSSTKIIKEVFLWC